MVYFKAFKGIHPKPEENNVDDIVSVPYDVISFGEAKEEGLENATSFLHVCSAT